MPDRYHLPDGYVSQDPAAFLDSPQRIEWQPDVLPYAAALAELNSVGTIIDVGCGFGRKLRPLAERFRCIGVDLPDVLAHVDTDGPVEWVPFDFSTRRKLPDALRTPAVIVCSDVVEHFADPRPLMRHLATMLEHSPALVISTPDRVLVRGERHMGPPPNPFHAREWQADEFVSWLESLGFDVVDQRYTRSSDHSEAEQAILVTVAGGR